MNTRFAALLLIAVAPLGCGGTKSNVGADAGGTVADLFVNGVLAPPSPSGNTCVYTTDPTEPALSSGRLDGALASSYAPTLLVGNSGLERIAVQGAQVRVVDPADGSTVESGAVLAAASVFAASGDVSSYASLQVPLLGASAAKHFTPAAGQPAKRAVVHLSVYGTTADGANVQSPEFQFPVDVCSGCLVTIPPAPSTASYCSGAMPMESAAAACVIGQDQSVDCQLCYSASEACKGS